MSDSAAWPAAVLPVFERALTVEYTSLTRDGRPITVPITPYLNPSRRTVDVSTGLSYPAKAERARRNPNVCLLFADGVGSGLDKPPVVLVQGLATVRDRDLQANTDRYVRETLAKLAPAFKGQPRFVLRRLNWYFARIWIEVTPMRMWWWPSPALAEQPSVWQAEVTAPPSDPSPPGKQPPAWLDPPRDWREIARHAVAHLDQRDLSWAGDDGFPLDVPILELQPHADGFRVHVGPHAPASPRGPACVTFHTHPTAFTGQENHTFVGDISSSGIFRVHRVLADISLTGNKLAMSLGWLAKGRRLSPRLKSEAARRSQPVPAVRLP